MFKISLFIYLLLLTVPTKASSLLTDDNANKEPTTKESVSLDKIISEEIKNVHEGIKMLYNQSEDFYHQRSLRVQAAFNSLMKFHSMGYENLEYNCLTNICTFTKVLEILDNQDDASTYWSLLNCIKYDILCGDGNHVTMWGKWGPCSSMCGTGVKVRYRNCTQAKNWGLPCDKDSLSQFITCEPKFNFACQEQIGKPDHWGSWSQWGNCDVTCGGGGHIRRTRSCLPHDTPLFCVGQNVEMLECKNLPCPVDGLWGEWGRWINDCGGTFCGSTVQHRSRLCDNPQPLGAGRRCVGASSNHQVCSGGTTCIMQLHPMHYFTKTSVIHYPTQPTSGFFLFFIHFKPISGGTLFYLIDRPKLTTSNVEISNLKTTNWNKNNVIVTIENDGIVKVEISLESDLVNMDLGKVEFGSWNTLRISVVSDVIHARLNDLDNIMGTLQDSPVSTPVYHNSTNNMWWDHFWGSDTARAKRAAPPSLKIPVPTGTKLRKTRRISVKFKAKFSIGNSVKGQQGFTGYVSRIVYNFQAFLFKKVSSDNDFTKLIEPLEVTGVTAMEEQGFNKEDINLPYFNGKHRMVIPCIMNWWNNQSSVEPEQATFNDAATLQIAFKPYNLNSLLLWNQGVNDDLAQIKVSIEKGICVKLSSVRGGNVVHLKTGNNLKMRRWNKVIIIFFRSGEVSMLLNGDKAQRIKLQEMTEETTPGPMWHLGGPKKSVLDSLFAKNNIHAKPFHGYVYSFMQNNVEFINFQRKVVNLKEMMSSQMTSNPLYWRFWYMLPSTKHSKVVASIQSDNLDTIYSNSQVRQINCFLPVTPGIITPPKLLWYKDDVPIDSHPMFMVRRTLTQDQVQSNLFLLPSIDSSKQLSGVYSCIANVDHSYYVVINHVVSFIHQDIANPSGLGVALNYITNALGIKDNLLVFVVLGGIAGGAIVLILICLIYRKLFGKKEKTQSKLVESESIEETEPLNEEEEPSTSHKHHRRRHRHGADHQHGRSIHHHSSRPRPSTGRRDLSSDDSDWLLAELIDREPDDVDFYEETKFLF